MYSLVSNGKIYIYVANARSPLVVKTKSASAMLIIRNPTLSILQLELFCCCCCCLYCVYTILIKINANFLINQLSFYVLRNANRSRRTCPSASRNPRANVGWPISSQAYFRAAIAFLYLLSLYTAATITTTKT